MSALLLVQMGWRTWLGPKAQMGFLASSPGLNSPTHPQESSWAIEVFPAQAGPARCISREEGADPEQAVELAQPPKARQAQAGGVCLRSSPLHAEPVSGLLGCIQEEGSSRFLG